MIATERRGRDAGRIRRPGELARGRRAGGLAATDLPPAPLVRRWLICTARHDRVLRRTGTARGADDSPGSRRPRRRLHGCRRRAVRGRHPGCESRAERTSRCQDRDFPPGLGQRAREADRGAHGPDRLRGVRGVRHREGTGRDHRRAAPRRSSSGSVPVRRGALPDPLDDRHEGASVLLSDEVPALRRAGRLGRIEPQRPSGPPDSMPDVIWRGPKMAFATSPTASTLSSTPWKQTIRHGQASRPS